MSTPSNGKPIGIIGCGPAGGFAALALAKAGKRVVVFRRGWGMGAAHGGGVTVAGPDVLSMRADFERKRSSWAFVEDLIKRHPNHPFGTLETRQEELEGALGSIRGALPSLGYDVNPVDKPPHLVPTDLGTWTFVHMAPRNCREGSLARILETENARVGVVGIDLYPAFHPGFLARAYPVFLKKLTDASVTFEPIELAWNSGRPSLTTPLQAAKFFETPDALAALAERTKKAMGEGKYTHLLFPPILGLERADGAMWLADKLGVEVAEAYGADRAPGGVRFQRALENALTRAGVELRSARVIASEIDSGAVTALMVERGGTSTEVERVEVSGVIYAAGDMLPDDVEENPQTNLRREKIFQLPIWCEGRPLSAGVWPGDLVRPDWADRHPLFEVGLMTDERCRPLDRDRKVAIENLAAAGNLLAGNNQPWDGAGVGFAACSGIKAAGLFLEPRAKGE